MGGRVCVMVPVRARPPDTTFPGGVPGFLGIIMLLLVSPIFCVGNVGFFKWCSLNYTPLSVTIFLRVPVTYTPYFLLLTFRRAGER